MSLIWFIFGLQAVFVALVSIEVFAYTKFHCDCSVISGRHFVGWLLFIEAIMQAGIGLLYYYADAMSGDAKLIQFAVDAFMVAVSVLYFRRWWKHTKNKKKKLEKILSKVKVTAAGLKVVPHSASTSM